MNGLEQTFYIMAIVFMSLIFIIMLGILTAVLVIRAKINRIHDTIERRIDAVSSFAEKGGVLTGIAGRQVLKQAKKAVRKASK